MGAIAYSLDNALVTFFTERLPLKLFVETGTFAGDTLAMASDTFSECYSVEQSAHYYEAARKRFAHRPNVNLHLGESAAFLRDSSARIRKQPTMIWLDAHWCDRGDTAGETSQSPLLKELDALEILHSQSVLLIDDARFYLSAPPPPHRIDDWPDFHDVATHILSLSSAHRLAVYNDVILFYPSSLRSDFTQWTHLHGESLSRLYKQAKKWRLYREEKKSRKAMQSKDDQKSSSKPLSP